MVRRQGQLGEQGHVGHMPGVHICERALMHHRRLLPSCRTDRGIAQLFDQNVPHLLPGNPGTDGVQIEDAAAGAASRTAEDVLLQVDVQMLLAGIRVTAGAGHIVGASSIGRLRDAKQRNHVRHVVEFHVASFPGMAIAAIPSVFLNSPAVPHTRRSSGPRRESSRRPGTWWQASAARRGQWSAPPGGIYR